MDVIVGALIIKELFDYSDDEMVEKLMLDLHLQYTLHTTSFEEQPLSDKSLSCFRKKCYDLDN
ncbi:transposase [Lachnospiraceae bacterium OttesenSCG-928-D06]|nr:transposase [Lachnospiraceae bacterium OttesenSCG-928-D06]